MKRIVFIAVFAILGLTAWRLRSVHAQSPVPAQVNGVGSQAIAIGGIFPLYNPSGALITNGRCVQSIVTTAATTGAWTLNYTAMGFTSVTSFRADALSPSTSQTIIGNQYVPHINSVTNTDISGTVTNNVTLTIATIAVTGIQFGSSPSQVSIGVCGS